VILTKNEERNLPRCLEAIPSRYPLIILDSGSTDKTLSIAKNRGCNIYKNEWPGFAAQRNYALEHCNITSDWVLFIDADEIFPPAFYEWFEDKVKRTKNIDAVMVHSNLIFCGQRLMYAPGYPIYHPRLVCTKKVRFISNHSGHGETILAKHVTIKATIPYDHYFYEGDSVEWMRRHIKNAVMEIGTNPAIDAKMTYRVLLNKLAGRTALRIPARFFYHYLWCRGFLDGSAGFRYSLMYTWYEMTKYVLRRGVGEILKNSALN
jgi:glycosyltransferase involved in cell wall biosynthesis